MLGRAGASCRKAAEFLASAIQAVIYLGLALIMSWRLTLIAFAVGGLILLAPNFLVKISRKAGQKQTDRTRQFVRGCAGHRRVAEATHTVQLRLA